ncbi:MAG: hypothetical protein E7485_08250 [Ruminococcaceae bacterium]|nr:hypothetical protein [Oscillospiraceae bacterium]
MDKLIFKIPRPAKKLNANDRPVMRITPEAYNAVEEISARTGLSNTYIASKMIEFAAANTEVVFEGQE